MGIFVSLNWSCQKGYVQATKVQYYNMRGRKQILRLTSKTKRVFTSSFDSGKVWELFNIASCFVQQQFLNFALISLQVELKVASNYFVTFGCHVALNQVQSQRLTYQCFAERVGWVFEGGREVKQCFFVYSVQINLKISYWIRHAAFLKVRICLL